MSNMPMLPASLPMTTAQICLYGAFIFALGACVGSFLNVVVWRLPRGESLSSPPSHCPKCQTPLKWFDNIPVLGWIMLRGRCRYCQQPISPQYPIVEAATALMFLFYFVMLMVYRLGRCPPIAEMGHMIGPMIPPPPNWRDWPLFAADLALLSGLLASSLIDAQLYIIPLGICWTLAAIGALIHTLFDLPNIAGALSADAQTGALALGGGIGLLLSLLLMRRGLLRQSFPEGEPLLEVDRAAAAAEAAAEASAQTSIAAQSATNPLQLGPSDAPPSDSSPIDPPPIDPTSPDPAASEPELTPAQIRREIRLEMLFLMPPLVLAIAVWLLAGSDMFANRWQSLVAVPPVGGFLGALLGALVGGFVVWLVRILGSMAFGRVAMGMGDVHLMFGIGAIIGPGPATVAFFLAPFFGLAAAAWRLLTRSHRELPYGPYLSLATGAVLLIYCPIAQYLSRGLVGLVQLTTWHAPRGLGP
jgi:leader peptidase (prepilin peptidase)/N-methyltransferase